MKTKLTNQKGFTIIEVLIVLAIAGLILLIVFLAVPALQRNSRNTQRKNDIGRIGGASTEFVSNNNGTLPALGAATLGTTPNDAGKIVTSAGKLSQYDFIDTSGSPGNFIVANNTTANAGIIDVIQLSVKAKCNPSSVGEVIPGTARQMALMYSVENSSGLTKLCTDV